MLLIKEVAGDVVVAISSWRCRRGDVVVAISPGIARSLGINARKVLPTATVLLSRR